ncbi:MAG: acyl-CoA dehydratase activase [Candidatus Brocadiia bacterium]
MSYFAGIDIGSSAIKVVILDQDSKIISKGLHKSGSDLKEASAKALNQALDGAKLKEADITRFAATGFGRSNCPFPNKTITEISAHARGVYYYLKNNATMVGGLKNKSQPTIVGCNSSADFISADSNSRTIIDIGGQDNKMIRIDASGRILNFRMNRKCAAGTGAFLEEIAYKMDIPLPELNRLAKLSTKPIELGSYCTVFTATEILSKIREGIKKEDIVCGVFRSIIKRIIEMDPLTDDVILTGGVIAHNDIIKELLSKTLNKDILVPADPQFTGALGAALFGTTDKH